MRYEDIYIIFINILRVKWLTDSKDSSLHFDNYQ